MKFVNLQRQEQQQQEIYRPEVTQSPPWTATTIIDNQEVARASNKTQQVKLTPEDILEFEYSAFTPHLYENKGLDSYRVFFSEFPVSKVEELPLKYPNTPEGTSSLVMDSAYSQLISLQNIVNSMVSLGVDTSGKLQEILLQSENTSLKGPRGTDNLTFRRALARSESFSRIHKRSCDGGIIGVVAGGSIEFLANITHRLDFFDGGPIRMIGESIVGWGVVFISSGGLALPQRIRQEYSEYQARNKIISDLGSTLTDVFKEHPELRNIAHTTLIEFAERRIGSINSHSFKKTLLRASTAPNDAGILLRPASSSSTPPEQLLRPSEE